MKKKGLDFPIPESREDDFVWIYGFVYDKKTLEITQVKGYLRYPTDQNTGSKLDTSKADKKFYKKIKEEKKLRKEFNKKFYN